MQQNIENRTMEELIPWFVIKSVPGIGNLLFKRLLKRFKSPDLIIKASEFELLSVKGISPKSVEVIKKCRITDEIKKEINLAAVKKCRIITFLDDEYPSLLREIPDCPPFLYVYGKLPSKKPAIAVVGSRNPTRYGISITRQLTSELASIGITIVSGMARGIDSAAHSGAIIGSGKTTAVLGSGLNEIYPSENRRLFKQIAENGAVVSEFPLNTRPESHNFPIRNRVISGMSLGTVVVEAAKKSGSLITARLAAEQNREVFAVPGSIHSFKSSGTHTLIKQGAKLVENARDIIEELYPFIDSDTRPVKKEEPAPKLSEQENSVYKMLGTYPVHIDDIVRELKIDSGKLSGILLQLELKGIVKQMPGKFFTASL